MTPTESGDRRAGLKSNLLERLYDPLQLRICVMSAVLLLGYGAIYMPLNNQITETSKKLDRDKKLLDLAGRLEQLQQQYQTVAKRIPPQADSKEWVQYVLEGIRSFPLKLTKLDFREPKQVGPYRVVVLQVELEGSCFDMDRLLCWFESNRRLFRADEVRIIPARDNKNILVLQLTVLGLAV
jgi:hypothetical protein